MRKKDDVRLVSLLYANFVGCGGPTPNFTTHKIHIKITEKPPVIRSTAEE